MPKKPSNPIPIATVKHKDKRANIPTKELRGFVADDEVKPKSVLYPRDPSLDPQLVWKGKDAQDAQPLSVPAVPIYIQEKIHPQAIIEDLRSGEWSVVSGEKGSSPQATRRSQLNLFADFNNIKFEDLIDFYRHEQNWSNRFILGDSLLVMTSLAEKEGLKGKVQCLYFDPPYGINFGSNWQVSTRKRDVKDGKAEDATRQPEQIRAFRDTWKLGIHSYLAYLRDRLTAARELLTESGSVFVQIGDENVHLVRNVLDEVFGSENFLGLITFRVKSPLNVAGLGRLSDFLLWYGKDAKQTKYRQLFTHKTAEDQTEFNMVQLPNGSRMTTHAALGKFSKLPEGSRLFTAQNLASSGYTESCTFTFQYNGQTFPSPGGKSWKTTKDGMSRLAVAGRLHPLTNSLRYAYFIDDFPVQEISNLWADTFAESDKDYVVQTSTRVIERCMLMTTDPGDLVLDPTCGSGTMAYVAEQWGRRWITIDTSRVAIALARTRLMAAKFPYYLLADSPEGMRKSGEWRVASGEKADTHHSPLTTNHCPDIRRGFVCKRVPHVTLKSIANNPDIKEGMSREQIDSAIAKHADTELLYDQPYEDNKRIRVTGPFTVESLSPHRMLSDEWRVASGEQRAASGEWRVASGEQETTRHTPLTTSHSFVTIILDNLRKAGVQNTRKGERLKFDRLETFANPVIHAKGEYTENGKVKTVGVFIGPEHGTVGPDDVKEAAKEAVKGQGVDLLVVCGFAFDPHVTEEAKNYGKLTILITRMNPDLAMGDELLKKTGAGNLFMVFGEVDLRVECGEWLVTRGGKLLMLRHEFEELSGVIGLAEINRVGGTDLRRFQKLSEGGKLRSDVADAAGSGVRGEQYRGGRGKGRDGRVSAIPEHSARVAGGTGNAASVGGTTGLSASSASQGVGEEMRRDWTDAERAEKVALIKALTAADFPLTTSHSAQVTILGLDVYDPTTGQIRNSKNTDDIACWFIDTDYNGESFFVRQAYFTGADEPYEKLKRALRAEIDESAWQSLYSTTSRPFPAPKTKKIAVKVINHYGDEVLKVWEVK